MSWFLLFTLCKELKILNELKKNNLANSYLVGDLGGDMTGDSCGDSSRCPRTGRKARGSSIEFTLLNAVNAPGWKEDAVTLFYKICIKFENSIPVILIYNTF